MYKIRYNYNTGDSFHNENNLESELEFEWKDLEVAKKNLERIEEHYKWYREVESNRSYHNRNEEKPKPPKWWIVTTGKYNKGFEHHQMNMVMDNGEEVIMSCPWCGYFESLNGAEIIVDLPKIVV